MLQLIRSKAFCSPQATTSQAPLHVCIKWLTAACIIAAITGCQSAIGRINLQAPQSTLSPPTSVAQLQSDSHAAASDAAPATVSIETEKLTWPDSIDALFLHARKLVETQLNVDLQEVRLLLTDDQPINNEVTRETSRLVNAQFGKNRFSTHFLSKVMDAQTGTYAALFSSRHNAVMVSKKMLHTYEKSLPPNTTLRNAALLTLLIHELVHAADDKRYHIHENRALNFRASFAQSAVFEGHAQWVTRNICTLNNCLSGLKALDQFMFNRHAAPSMLSQPVEAISHNVLEYSYVEGENFIASLAKREKSDQLLASVLTSPPQDPIQILSPDSFPDTGRENRNQRLIRAGLDIDHPWVQGDWIGVETSPLKGVNLRTDPSARTAAIDGFTRLINSIVSLQLYDKTRPDAAPMEVTVLQTESSHTATLFARTLHANTIEPESTSHDESVIVKMTAVQEKSEMKAHLYRTALPGIVSHKTTIAVSGNYLVQIAGQSISQVILDDYVVRVLLHLTQEKNNPLVATQE